MNPIDDARNDATSIMQQHLCIVESVRKNELRGHNDRNIESVSSPSIQNKLPITRVPTAFPNFPSPHIHHRYLLALHRSPIEIIIVHIRPQV